MSEDIVHFHQQAVGAQANTNKFFSALVTSGFAPASQESISFPLHRQASLPLSSGCWTHLPEKQSARLLEPDQENAANAYHQQ